MDEHDPTGPHVLTARQRALILGPVPPIDRDDTLEDLSASIEALCHRSPVDSWLWDLADALTRAAMEANNG